MLASKIVEMDLHRLRTFTTVNAHTATIHELFLKHLTEELTATEVLLGRQTDLYRNLRQRYGYTDVRTTFKTRLLAKILREDVTSPLIEDFI